LEQQGAAVSLPLLERAIGPAIPPEVQKVMELKSWYVNLMEVEAQKSGCLPLGFFTKVLEDAPHLGALAA
jgi:hypothetical protein